MRVAGRMTRWIHPDWPQELTLEHSLLVNENAEIYRFIVVREFRNAASQIR